MSGTLERIEGIVAGGGDPDDVLRTVVDALAAEPDISWAGIVFREEGGQVLGPRAGEPDEPRRIRVPVEYQGDRVAELVVDGRADPAFLERVAALISVHCLVGWDTGGVPWDDGAA